MYEQRLLNSDLIRAVWYARVEAPLSFGIRATEYWGFGFARFTDGRLKAEVFGPSAVAQQLITDAAGTEYWGVELHTHVACASINKSQLRGVFRELPVRDEEFQLGERWFPVYPYAQLEVLIDVMRTRNVLVPRAAVAAALSGRRDGFSERTWQRHVKQTTGLATERIAQLQRARRAYRLLTAGGELVDVALEAGYADQSHMTRAFRSLLGETPGVVRARVKRRRGKAEEER